MRDCWFFDESKNNFFFVTRLSYKIPVHNERREVVALKTADKESHDIP